MILQETEKDSLLKAAILAPSADNSQPHTFCWRENGELVLAIDPTRSGKASDQRFVLSDIALGTVIENIVIQAKALGLLASVDLLPDAEPMSHHVATISFEKQEIVDNADQLFADEIPKRCTDRRFPFKGPIESKLLEELSSATQIADCSAAFFNDKVNRKQVLPIIRQAESIRFKSKILHQELFSTIKFDEEKPLEGMPISTLAIEAVALPFFKMMRKWETMNLFNKFGAASMLGLRSVWLPIATSPGLALIKIPGNSRQDVINGGRAIQRFWLKASQLGLAVQPYAAPGIFSLGHLKIEENLQPAMDAVGENMKSVVGEDNYGLMFLRFGFNKPVKHRSFRREPDSFMTDDC